MESNRAPNNQMAIRGVVLVLALAAAGAFVLARGLDDDPSPSAAESTPEPTMTAEPLPTAVDGSSSENGDDETVPEPAASPVADEGDSGATQDPAPTQAPADEPAEELSCRDPANIGVLVANGTDISGAAGRLSTQLNTGNYTTLPPANASAQTGSAIYYRPGYDVDAMCIANFLGAGSVPTYVMPDPPPGGVILGNAFILVLIGPDSLAQSGG